MKNNILLKTNLFVCVVIVFGFIITSVTSYHSNSGIFERDVERVSNLTAEGISHQIDSRFIKPVNTSLTMANDQFLINFLSEETGRLEDPAFIQQMRDYLLAYHETYNYDSVFLVSTETNRYYHFNGVDRTLTPDNPENNWYYAFLESDEEYSLNIDNDEAANNEITVFVNCKIRNEDQTVMGIVGVGFRVDGLQRTLKEYENRFDVRAYLINKEGTIEISTDQTGFEKTDLFKKDAYSAFREQILSERKGSRAFWYPRPDSHGYLVTQYIPSLEWHLVIDNDTSTLNKELKQQLYHGTLIVVVVILLVLIIITHIIRAYNSQLTKLQEREQEHRTIFQKETKKLYEDIYEIDITHNRAASEATEHYFESLGAPRQTPYDRALEIIARQQIKEEFREGYVSTFCTANVLQAYEDGKEVLTYDFMISNDGATYYWMRITARIFYWDEDKSIRMFVYRKNIDAEKKQQRQMMEQLQKDSLSGLYNKAATQEYIRALLKKNPDQLYAFIILDIDDFKKVNDTLGHATGDLVIADFAGILKRQFRPDDIVGRIGGDEFAVFIPIPSRAWAVDKARTLIPALRHEFFDGTRRCSISASVGVTIAPESGKDFETLYQNADAALYLTKKNGKDGFTIFH